MDAEDPVEQGTVGDGGGAHNSDGDLHNRPDGGVVVGPSGIEEGETVQFEDAVD